MDVNINGIHSTAIIDENAKIGKNVHIGPFTVIGENVEIGDGTKIGISVLIEKNTKIGKNCKIFKGASLGTDPQDLKYNGEKTYLEIGDNVIIREYSTFNRGTIENLYTRIGSNCTFLSYSHVAHDCEIGDNVIFSNNATVGGHTRIGNHVIVSAFSAVHQFCRVGDYAFIQVGAIITKDAPPVAMVSAGLNGKCVSINFEKLKRLGYSQEEIKEVKKIHRLLFSKHQTRQESLEEIEREYPYSEWAKLIVKFVKESKRGILNGI